jgi:hypothetical protein
MEILKKSIHGFFQRVLSRHMSVTASPNQRLNALFALGPSCPKQETLDDLVFPCRGEGAASTRASRPMKQVHGIAAISHCSRPWALHHDGVTQAALS